MTQNELANSANLFRRQKDHFTVEIQLIQNELEPIFKITVLNTQTNIRCSLQMDKVEITRDKVLGNIFRNAQELYEELVSGFEEIMIEENKSSMLIKYEVKVGKFRTELITLEIKQHLQREGEKEKPNIQSPQQKKKVLIDKSYARDLISFKEDFNKICEKICQKDVLAKLNINNDRNTRIKVKNMCIAFANSILKTYRKNAEFSDIQITEQECFTQPANKLLTQKNELLENILLKAIRRIKETPTQQIDIDFMPQIPTDLLVVKEDGTQVTLEKYLANFPRDQIENRIKYHQKKRERMMNSFNFITQLKKQRADEMTKILEKCQSEKRSSRLSLSNKNNPSDGLQFDQF